MISPIALHNQQGKSEGFDSCNRPSNLTHRFFSSCDPEIWWMTPKNNPTSLLCYFKLFASFHTHWWSQTGVIVRKCLIWVKINDFFCCVTFKLDRWPWKTIGHLFYVTSSFVHHFIPIGELVTVQKRPIWVKINDFFSCVTFKLDGWP